MAVNKTKPLPLRSLKPSKELVISFSIVRSRLLELKPIKHIQNDMKLVLDTLNVLPERLDCGRP